MDNFSPEKVRVENAKDQHQNEHYPIWKCDKAA
jgi:hypothetical protein